MSACRKVAGAGVKTCHSPATFGGCETAYLHALIRLPPHLIRSSDVCQMQSAYRAGHSTETALRNLINDVRRTAGSGSALLVLEYRRRSAQSVSTIWKTELVTTAVWCRSGLAGVHRLRRTFQPNTVRICRSNRKRHGSDVYMPCMGLLLVT